MPTAARTPLPVHTFELLDEARWQPWKAAGRAASLREAATMRTVWALALLAAVSGVVRAILSPR